MVNHHHFVLRLTDGGLSDCLREVHGRYSRRIHEIYDKTGTGHLVRHGFFARELKSDAEILVVCRYVDLNVSAALGVLPSEAKWCGYRATVGLEKPQPFHEPDELLRIISPRRDAAQFAYRHFVTAGLGSLGRVPSPNQGYESRTPARG